VGEAAADSGGDVHAVAGRGVQRRKLNFEAKFESGSSFSSFKR